MEMCIASAQTKAVGKPTTWSATNIKKEKERDIIKKGTEEETEDTQTQSE